MPDPEVPTAAHAWVVLRKAAAAVESNARRHVESIHLGMSDFAVLEVLFQKGPLPVNTIGHKVLLTSGSITTAIDRLESKQLVERRDDPSDRRARVVHLTEPGRLLISCAFAGHAAALEAVFAPLNAAERRSLVRLLKKLGYHAAELAGTSRGSAP